MKDPETYRKEFIDLCTACGLCAVMCPPFSHRSVKIPYQEIQKQVRSCLEGNPPSNAVLQRSRLCDECYLCVSDTCPQGLDPMRTNQFLRGLLHNQGVDPWPFIPPSDETSSERIIAALLTTEDEYERITTPAVKGDGRVLFFAGCNVYYQPHLLLTALDVLDLIADHWTFLPGLTHCCGNNYDSSGRLAAGAEAMKKLSDRLKDDDLEVVAVWCPTCAARFYHAGSDLPVISYARLVADRVGRLIDGESISGGLTLHEACKVAYLGLDPDAPRDLLNLLARNPVQEMSRHGRDTACCSWSLHQNMPETGDEDRKNRLAEAAATGAGILATVCHGCQWILDVPGAESSIRIANYISLVGEALGVRHRNRFLEMREMVDAEAAISFIREVMGDRIDQLPFDRDQIMRAVDVLLGDFTGPRPGFRIDHPEAASTE